MAKRAGASSFLHKIAILRTVFLSPQQLKILQSRIQCPVISRSSAEFVTEAEKVLMINDGGMLQLVDTGKKNTKGVKVNFSSKAQAYRRQLGGGKKQAIAKAVGIPDAIRPLHILDLTAGLGNDAFVLATLGCYITLLERSAIVFSLLEDGLNRAAQDPAITEIVKRMSLHYVDAAHFLRQSPQKWDVIYLDPMFPCKKKQAAVKKEMQCLQTILYGDTDADSLLPIALEKAYYRVVVKRPAAAFYLNNTAPCYQLKGKSCRFDVYTLRSVKKI